jgi:hypothetical protein
VRSLEALGVREYRSILCANMACTLLWLLPALLPSLIPVIGRGSIALLGWESLLRIGTGFLWVTLEYARVGLGLVDGVWLALLLVE